MTNIKEWFEANYLDGDKVQKGQMLSSSECLEAITTAKREALQEVAGGIFNRCNQLRMEIANQEEEHGLVDTSTLDRLNEAEKMYAELSTHLE